MVLKSDYVRGSTFSHTDANELASTVNDAVVVLGQKASASAVAAGLAGKADVSALGGFLSKEEAAEHYAPVFQPLTAYATGATVVLPAPVSAIGKRTAGGTSRAAFDSTEQALWTVAATGAAAAGPTMHVFVTELQSNALGTNSAGTADPTKYDSTNVDVPNARIFAFQGSGANANTIVQAVEPLAGPVNAQGMGPMGPMAREYLRTLPPGDAILLVQAAVGSTGYGASSTSGTSYRWQVADVGGTTNLHTKMKSMLAAAFTAATALGYSPKLVAVINQGGEADGDGGITGPAFAAFMDASIADLRSTYPATPLLVGRMATPRRDSTATGPAIDLAQVNAPARLELCATVAPLDTARLASDNTHADATGQRINGHNFAQALAYARANVKGIMPVAPPIVRKSTVGSLTTINWDAPLGRVIDYKIEYLDYASGSWTAITHTASLLRTATVTAANAPAQVRVSSVNEAGTSEPTYSAATTSTPGETALPTPTGVAVVSPSSTSLYAIANPSEGATSYQWEYRKASDSTVITTAASPDPSVTLTGLDANTAYVLRPIAKATGASSPAGLFTTVRTSNAQSALTFGRTCALRKVVAAYPGPAVRVRNGTTGTEIDIPFSGVDLDLAALRTAAGATGSLYVVTVYDQSGNARHLTQATTTKQPLIVDNGTVLTMNGRPTMLFDGTDDYLWNNTAGAFAAGAASFLGVVQLPVFTDTLGRAIAAESWSGGSNTAYIVEHYKASLTQFFRGNTSTPTVLARTTANEAPVLADDTAKQFSFVDTGTVVSKRVNAVALADQSYTRNSTTTLDRNSVGGYFRSTASESEFLSGRLAEVLTVFSALSTTDRDALEAQQKAYYGTA